MSVGERGRGGGGAGVRGAAGGVGGGAGGGGPGQHAALRLRHRRYDQLAQEVPQARRRRRRRPCPTRFLSPDAAPRPHPRHLILLHACQLLEPAREIVAAAGRRWPRRATMRARARGGDGGL